MKRTILAKYERKSTLWKNANGFYRAYDWTMMECAIVDCSDDREYYKTIGLRVSDPNTGEDITDKHIAERYRDGYEITLKSKRGMSESVLYDTKDEANKAFLDLQNHPIYNKWVKVKRFGDLT